MIPRLLLSFAVLLLVAVPAVAQTDTTRFERLWLDYQYDGPRRIEISAAGGYAFSTAWSDLVALQVFDAHGGIHRQVLLRNVSIAPGAGVGAAVTYWRGRHAFRVHSGYSRSCLTTASRCDGADPPAADGAALGIAEVPIDVWRYGVEGLVGLRSWGESSFWRPYLVVGAGGVTYDAERGALPFLPGTFETLAPPPDSPPGTVLISDGTTTFLIGTSELGLEHVFGLTIGAGMDLRMPVGIGGVGLRIELIDQITSSPFHVRVARLDGGRRAAFDRDDVFFDGRAIHNVRLMAGVFIELGMPGPREERDPWARRR